MKWIKSIIFVLFLSVSSLKAQEMKVIDGDTLVTITLEDMRIINSVFEDQKSLGYELDVKQAIIDKQISIISDQDSIRKNQIKIIEAQDATIKESDKVIENLDKKVNRLQRMKKIYGTGGLAIGFGLACLIFI